MRLHRNVGSLDRIIRVIAGVAIGIALIAGLVSGPFTVALGVVAAILVVTGASGFCPLYALLRVSTRPSRT